MSSNIQLTENGELKHFLSIEGLPKQVLTEIMDRASTFIDPQTEELKKFPLLRDTTVATLFFENSTRTRLTFEIAANRLSADAVTLDMKTSSSAKGETDLDTLLNLRAMGCDIFIIRHSEFGAPLRIAESVDNVAIINAGDGSRAHPTQAMLDMYTIRHHKGSFENLTVAIIGDIEHSRVARSEVNALKILGAKEIRLIAPPELLPASFADEQVKLFHNIEEGVTNADVVICLRIQKERMNQDIIPDDATYFEHYGLTQKRLSLAKPDAIVMHPGPMNREVEIASDVADGKQSVILQQVRFGIAVRMAVLAMTASTQRVLLNK